MPGLSWRAIARADPGSGGWAAATRGRVHRRRDLPGVLAGTAALWGELERAEGLLGYGVAFSPRHGSLATLSLWRTPADLRRFVAGPAHRHVVAGTRSKISDSIAVGWELAEAALAPNWDEAHRRLDAAAGTAPR